MGLLELPKPNPNPNTNPNPTYPTELSFDGVGDPSIGDGGKIVGFTGLALGLGLVWFS